MSVAAGFLASKYFLISAAIATAIVAGAATAYIATDRVGMSWWGEHGCDAPSLSGRELVAAPGVLVEEDGTRRTQTYVLDAAAFELGALDLCLSVGEILVEPASGSRVEIVVLTTSPLAGAVSGTIVPVEFRADGDRLVIAAWEEVRGEAGGFFGERSANVRLTIRLPASAVYDVRAQNDVGDVRVSGLMIGGLDASVDVGALIVREVDLMGNATLTTDVGDAILHALSVQSGRIEIAADIGNAEALLPSRADVGYDARASTNVGDAVIRIGETERSETEQEGPGQTGSARSAGFEGKPTRVEVVVHADVGDARITTE